jgi:Uma2 family endonuclease
MYSFLMAKSALRTGHQGPFRADQLRAGDPYELSNGHPVECLPTGGRGGRAANVGGGVLASDPAVQDVGVEVGFSPSPEILRAPDLAVGEIPDQPGWVNGAPPLAVEYADTGQDEADLQIKIRELFSAGTLYLWVVRLTGPRRVEVHQPGQAMRTLHPGEQLTAPGVLANPIPVEALYDREAARRVIFSNLLQREGYASLEEVRAEGVAQGVVQGEIQTLRDNVLAVLTARGLAVDNELRTALARAQEPTILRSALRLAATTTAPGEIVTALRGETPA